MHACKVEGRPGRRVWRGGGGVVRTETKICCQLEPVWGGLPAQHS